MYLYFSHADPVHPEEDGVDGPGSEDGVEHPLEVAGHPLGPVDGGRHLQDGEVILTVENLGQTVLVANFGTRQ